MAATNSINSNYAKRPNNVVVTNSYNENFPERIKKIDRSDMGVKNSNIRNIRTSNMPGTPKNQTDNTRKTVDQNFNDTYQQAGINSPNLNRPVAEKYQSVPQIDRGVRVEYTNQSSSPINTYQTLKNPNTLSTFKKNKERLSRIRVTRTNVWVWSTGLGSWAFFQFPLALISTVFFSFSLGLASAIETVTTIESDDGFVTAGLKTLSSATLSILNGAVDLIKSVTGFDLESLNPINFTLILNAVILFYGLFVLFIIAFIYKIQFINPIFGREGIGLKTVFFILALIGYFLPISNLLPWFLPWTIAVWLKPK